MKKITIPKEVLYLIAIILLSFGVTLSVVANLGIATCSAPGLVISLKMKQILNKATMSAFSYKVLTSLAFGEWCIQTIMLIIFCLAIRRFRIIYLSSFVTTFLCGALFLFWREIPCFEAGVIYPYYLRVILLLLAIIIIAFSVTLLFKNYFYPQVYNFQEKGYIEHFHWKHISLVKVIFDMIYGLIAFILIGILFKSAKIWEHGLNWGTIVSMVFTGPLIGAFTKLINKTINTKTLFSKLEKAFEIENKKGY